MMVGGDLEKRYAKTFCSAGEVLKISLSALFRFLSDRRGMLPGASLDTIHRRLPD